MTTIIETSADQRSADNGVTATPAAAAVDIAAVQAFAEKVGHDIGLASNAVLAYLGDRLGIWRTLASVPSVTSASLAERTGLAERYLREWLSAQAAAGYLDYDPATATFRLPAEKALVLADDDSPAALAGGFEFLAAAWSNADRLAHAFASGDGIPWAAHDPRMSTSTERFFRPLYTGSLTTQWIPAIAGLPERLAAGGRVLDVGCGLGTASRLLAQAFPALTVVGIDDHADSIRQASDAARRAGVQDRVTFREASAIDAAAGGPFDAVFFFDALHDLGDPVGALRAARAVLAEDGFVVAVEPAAADHLEDNLHPISLSWFASSTMVCVPGSLSQDGGAALGAQAGPERLLETFHAAGLSDARVVATTPFNQVLAARV